MKSNFEQRRQNRINHAKKQAEKNAKDAKRLNDAAFEMTSHIPPGQPILVGHHSEKAHRRHLAKAWDTMGKSVKADEKAAYYAEKARTIEQNDAISSDDPQAVERLTEKITQLEQQQRFMKTANACVRKNNRAAFLELTGATPALWDALTTPGITGNYGFPAYKLTNNSANIRRLKARLNALKATAEKETEEITVKGIRIVSNVEDNRLQLFFPAKPNEETRKALHKRYGFRWSGSVGAWQRFLNNNGIAAAKDFLKNYDEPAKDT